MIFDWPMSNQLRIFQTKIRKEEIIFLRHLPLSVGFFLLFLCLVCMFLCFFVRLCWKRVDHIILWRGEESLGPYLFFFLCWIILFVSFFVLFVCLCWKRVNHIILWRGEEPLDLPVELGVEGEYVENGRKGGRQQSEYQRTNLPLFNVCPQF